MSRGARDAPPLTVREMARTFLPYVRPHWRVLLLAGLLVVAGTGVSLLRPWPLKFLFDRVLIPDTRVQSVQGVLALVAIGIAGIAVLDGLLGFVRQYLLQAAGQRVAFRLQVALYGQIQRLSLTFHDRQQTGELITRVTKDVEKVQELTIDSVVDGSSNLLKLAGMVGVMVWLDWQLSAAMVVALPPLFLAITRHRRRIRHAERQARRTEGDIVSLAHETIASIRLVKAFGREDYECDRFETQTEEALGANLRVTRAEATFGTVMDAVTALTTAGLVWFGAQRVLAGSLTPGDLLIFIAYVRDFYGPVRALSKLAGRVSRVGVRAEKIAEVLREAPAVQDRPGARAAPPFRGDVRFDRVGFAYVPGCPVLSDVSFHIEPGRTLALVGSTGAGKSTVATLIARLYDPTEGRVLIDGRDVRDYTLPSLQSQVSWVLQSSVLFRATVRENIAYGRPDATLEQIVEAARVANAHEFISALPDAYDAVIGERGETLSGGQRQRIAIARAVVRNAPILILDEPTTGLDARSERLVLDALYRLMAGRTTIVIAHKLDTVRHADEILVLDHGRVVERGSHAELLGLGGRYADLAALQSAREPSLR